MSNFLRLLALVLVVSGEMIMIYLFKIDILYSFIISTWTIVYGALLGISEIVKPMKKYRKRRW